MTSSWKNNILYCSVVYWSVSSLSYIYKFYPWWNMTVKSQSITLVATYFSQCKTSVQVILVQNLTVGFLFVSALSRFHCCALFCCGYAMVDSLKQSHDCPSVSEMAWEDGQKWHILNDNDNGNGVNLLSWSYIISIEYTKQHTCNQYNIFTCFWEKLVAFLRGNDGRKPWLIRKCELCAYVESHGIVLYSLRNKQTMMTSWHGNLSTILTHCEGTCHLTKGQSVMRTFGVYFWY